MTKDTKTVGDMYLAAALLAYGLKLTNVDKADAHHQRFSLSGVVDRIFVINDDDLCEVISNPKLMDIELHYTSKTLLYPPEYPESIRRIKTLIHAE